MADEKLTGRPLDSTGETVRSNIRRVRDQQGISGPDLSAKLAGLGRPIPPLGIHRIEAGKRRVDVDDLIGLAVALQVSPMTLLAPPSTSGNQPVSVVGAGELAARDLIAWLRGDAPLPGQEASANMHWTLPEWFIEMQNALSASDIQWQQEMQFEREKLESDNRALINQADRLTETARRQAETIEILVRKLAELGVEVRRAPRGDG